METEARTIEDESGGSVEHDYQIRKDEDESIRQASEAEGAHSTSAISQDSQNSLNNEALPTELEESVPDSANASTLSRDIAQLRNTSKFKAQELRDQIARIHAQFNATRAKFEDIDFPAINSSLFYSDNKLRSALSEQKTWRWIRPEENAKDGKLTVALAQCNELRCGSYSSYSFLNAFSIVLTHNHISNLIVDCDHLEKGYAVFQFFRHGEWKYVLIDTLLPYASESKKYLFSSHGFPDAVLVSLMEKALAKLNGKYEALNMMNYAEALGQLCCCNIEVIKMNPQDYKTPATMKKFFSSLYKMVTSKEKTFLSCMKEDLTLMNKNNFEIGESGILRNFLHAINGLEEINTKDLRFVRIKNVWGTESNWSGPFSNNADDWEKVKDLREQLFSSKKFPSSDFNCTFYMKLENFVKEFNVIHVIRIFDSSWRCFSLQGVWAGKTNAGPATPASVKFPEPSRRVRGQTQLDSDDGWFNNPQFRIKISRPTKFFMTLSQFEPAEPSSGHPTLGPNGKERRRQAVYQPMSFIIAKNKDFNNRLWEYPDETNIAVSSPSETPRPEDENRLSKFKSSEGEEQEVLRNHFEMGESDVSRLHKTLTQEFELGPFADSSAGFYTLVVALARRDRSLKEKVPFYVSLFANNPVEVDELPPTIDQELLGSWEKEAPGGPLHPLPQKHSENLHWCTNPQYFLFFDRPTYLRIVLQKGKNSKKIKDAKMGLTAIFLKTSPEYRFEMAPNQTLVAPVSKKNPKEFLKASIHAKAQELLRKPQLLNFRKKIQVTPSEKYIETTYASSDLACFFLKVNPIEGPLLLVPSLEKSGLVGDYKLAFYSNSPVTVQMADSQKNPLFISEWTNYNAGGAHIFSEGLYSNPEKCSWRSNPVYLLRFSSPVESPEKFPISISLRVGENNWKESVLKHKEANIQDKKKLKINMINVSTMICLYGIKEGTPGKWSPSDIVFDTGFKPSNYLDHTFVFDPAKFEKNQEIYLMPTTYHSGIETKFILAAYCEKPIELIPISN